jgi:hypothetical protein
MKSRTGPLKNEHGVWVLHTGKPLSASATDELLQRIREERDLANLGEDTDGAGQGAGKREWGRVLAKNTSPAGSNSPSASRTARP